MPASLSEDRGKTTAVSDGSQAIGNPHAPVGSDGSELRSTRIFLRPIANPFALGFTGLAVATLLLSGMELGWISGADRVQTAVLIIAFAPTIQLVACVFGFLARDAIAATALGVQAMTWLAIGLSLLLAKPTSHGHSHELALLLFVSGTVMLASAGNAAHTKLVPALVVGLTGLRYLLTGVYKLGNGIVWEHAAAWTGIVLCAMAVYAVISLETEDIRHHTVLPTLRRGKGKTVLEPRLAEQVQEVAAEAGVRSQL
ncbi:MAG: acetate uptake transporter family protein [Solirubrobacteraceae bacterium]